MIQNREISKGFFLIEVILAIAILSLVFVGLFTTLSFLTNRTERAKYDAQAADLIQQAVEVVRSSLSTDWDLYAPGDYRLVYDASSGRWIARAGQESILEGRFTRKTSVDRVCRNTDGNRVACGGGVRVDEKSKIINVTLKWSEGTGEKTSQASLLVYRIGQ